MTRESQDPLLCTEEGRIARLESEVSDMKGEISNVRAMVVGKAPEENDGLRKDVRSIADSLREFKAENKFLKWGLGTLIVLKTPDAVEWLAHLLSKGPK